VRMLSLNIPDQGRPTDRQPYVLVPRITLHLGNKVSNRIQSSPVSTHHDDLETAPRGGVVGRVAPGAQRHRVLGRGPVRPEPNRGRGGRGLVCFLIGHATSGPGRIHVRRHP
jgi:hypothetical protein